MATLSTIVTTYHNHELTLAHLRLSQDVSRLPDEVIVVNDGGDEGLIDKVRDLPRKVPFVYARVTEDIVWNYNGACNLAVWLSKGDFLGFEDNDNIPSYTFYENALKAAEQHPNVVRFQGGKRKVVSKDDVLNKERKDWTILRPMGPNMGSAIIRRDAYLKIKGQDERFCGRYGWMYYDLRSRMMGYSGPENYTVSLDEFFYTDEGQSDLSRERTNENRGYYVENARRVESGGHQQHPEGILNFAYEYERMAPNA